MQYIRGWLTKVPNVERKLKSTMLQNLLPFISTVTLFPDLRCIQDSNTDRPLLWWCMYCGNGIFVCMFVCMYVHTVNTMYVCMYACISASTYVRMVVCLPQITPLLMVTPEERLVFSHLTTWATPSTAASVGTTTLTGAPPHTRTRMSVCGENAQTMVRESIYTL